MLPNIHDVEEIVEFVQGLFDKQNGKHTLARLFGMAQRYEAIQKKEDEIERALNLSRGERVVQTSIINEVIAIVEIENNKDGDVYYQAVINGKPYREVSETFDYALLIALGKKYDVVSYAPQAIHNILQMDKFEEQNRPKTFTDLF
ncbi:hypothetical protein SMD22_01295 (plasmid) [Brevibacillus halotolerans]|nr:hypothetical protein SMD22_01295 [Brevibacillus halotolerans]